MISADDIRAIMGAAGLKQAGLAERIGVTQPTVSRWLKGATPDPAQEEALRKLAAEVSDGYRPGLISSYDPDEPDRGDADYEPRMVEGSEGRDVGDLPENAILQADIYVGMGGGGITHVTELMNPDGNSYAAEAIAGWWQMPDQVVKGLFRVPPRRIRCFQGAGDSMLPTVADGDIIFIDVGHRVPSPPGIYALADALGGVVLKRLTVPTARRKDPVFVQITSDNPSHPPEERTLDEITILGRYLGRLTTG